MLLECGTVNPEGTSLTVCSQDYLHQYQWQKSCFLWHTGVCNGKARTQGRAFPLSKSGSARGCRSVPMDRTLSFCLGAPSGSEDPCGDPWPEFPCVVFALEPADLLVDGRLQQVIH